MMKRLVMAGVALVMALGTWAEDGVDRNTCYLVTNISGSGKGCATTNAACWAVGSESGPVLGEAGEIPPPENDYVVRNKYKIQFQGNGKYFKCHSLQIGDLDANTSGVINNYTKGSAMTVDGELICALGDCCTMSSSGTYFLVADRITVTAAESKPFTFSHRYANSTLTLQAPVYGAIGTGLGLGFKGTSVDSPGSNDVYVVTNDWSHFAGTLCVTSLMARASSYFSTKIVFGAVELPGTLKVGPETILEFAESGVARVGNLSLGDNVLLTLARGASLEVTGAFSQNGTVHIGYAHEPPMNGKTNDVELLRVPAGAVLDAANFVLEDGGATTWGHLGHELLVKVDAETGAQALCVRFPPMVCLTETDVSTFNQAKDDVPYPNSMTNAAHWSDGLLPHAGAHYLVMRRDGMAMYLRTPQQTNGVNDNKIDFTFPGESLTIADDCRMTVFGAKFRAKQIYILDGGDIQNGQTHYPDIYAPIHMPSGTAYLSAYNGNTMAIYGELTGCARLVLGSVSGGTSAPSGGEYPASLNTNFLGTIDAGLRANKTKPTYDKTYHTLNVADERNLGGRLPAFDPTALRVHGPFERLAAKADVTFTTNYNRGVYFYDIPVINTQGHRMTFKTVVGVNGTLFKEGEGTLELGGTLAFADATAELPTAGSNTLDIVKGTLAVSALDAVNGLAIAFSNNTELVLMPDFEDAAFTRWGVRNVKTGVPFAVAADAQVAFRVEAQTPPTHKCTLGLLTVPNEADAKTVAHRLVGTPGKFFSGTTQSAVREIVDEAAQVVTLAVDIRIPGTSLLLR